MVRAIREPLPRAQSSTLPERARELIRKLSDITAVSRKPSLFHGKASWSMILGENVHQEVHGNLMGQGVALVQPFISPYKVTDSHFVPRPNSQMQHSVRLLSDLQ